MGADFTRKTAHTFRKTWDRARVTLTTADLFTRRPERIKHSAAFDFSNDNVQLKIGDRVVVENQSGCLVARVHLTEVGRNSKPSQELLSAMSGSANIADGVVEKLYGLAGKAEISLC